MSAAKKPQSKFNTLPPIAGAALITAVAVYPVDVVRALKMSSTTGASAGQLVGEFYKAHGAMGFIKQGVGPEMARATWSRILKFFLQPVVHESVFGKKTTEGSNFTRGLAGAIATIPEVLSIAPMENAKIALQLDKEKRFKGSNDVMKHLMKTRGPLGLMLGYPGMQMRQCLWTGTFFMTLDFYRDSVAIPMFGKGHIMSDVSSGFMAGVTGTMVNCWTDVVRTQIQKEALADLHAVREPYDLKYFVGGVLGFFQKTATIAAERGIGGLYAGVGFKAIHLGGSGALLAVLVPRLKTMWGCE